MLFTMASLCQAGAVPGSCDIPASSRAMNYMTEYLPPMDWTEPALQQRCSIWYEFAEALDVINISYFAPRPEGENDTGWDDDQQQVADQMQADMGKAGALAQEGRLFEAIQVMDGIVSYFGKVPIDGVDRLSLLGSVQYRLANFYGQLAYRQNVDENIPSNQVPFDETLQKTIAHLNSARQYALQSGDEKLNSLVDRLTTQLRDAGVISDAEMPTPADTEMPTPANESVNQSTQAIQDMVRASINTINTLNGALKFDEALSLARDVVGKCLGTPPVVEGFAQHNLAVTILEAGRYYFYGDGQQHEHLGEQIRWFLLLDEGQQAAERAVELMPKYENAQGCLNALANAPRAEILTKLFNALLEAGEQRISLDDYLGAIDYFDQTLDFLRKAGNTNENWEGVAHFKIAKTIMNGSKTAAEWASGDEGLYKEQRERELNLMERMHALVPRGYQEAQLAAKLLPNDTAAQKALMLYEEWKFNLPFLFDTQGKSLSGQAAPTPQLQSDPHTDPTAPVQSWPVARLVAATADDVRKGLAEHGLDTSEEAVDVVSRFLGTIRVVDTLLDTCSIAEASQFIGTARELAATLQQSAILVEKWPELQYEIELNAKRERVIEALAPVEIAWQQTAPSLFRQGRFIDAAKAFSLAAENAKQILTELPAAIDDPSFNQLRTDLPRFINENGVCRMAQSSFRVSPRQCYWNSKQC